MACPVACGSAINELKATLALTEKVIAQTRVRLSGHTPDNSTRIVSLNDPDARPIIRWS